MWNLIAPQPGIRSTHPALEGEILTTRAPGASCIHNRGLWAHSGTSGKAASAGDVRDTGLNPELGRSPGGGNGNPFQYPCLEDPMNRRAWWATVYGVAKSHMTERLNNMILAGASTWLVTQPVTLPRCPSKLLSVPFRTPF